MSKLIIGIILVVAVGGGYYLYSSPKNVSTDSVNQQAPVVPDAKVPTGKKMAFSEFMKQNGSYQCTVTQNVNNTSVNGTVFINDGKIRGEFSTSYNGTNMNISTIARDGYSYTWTSMMPTMGFKAKIVENATGDANASASGSYSWNAEHIGDYNCEAWSPDASKFSLPTSVTFTETGK